MLVLHVSLCVTRLLIRQQVNSSLKELHEWPPWLSPLSRPSPHLSSHIRPSAAPQLQRWLQVSVFSEHYLRTNHLVIFALLYFLHNSVLFSILRSWNYKVQQVWEVPFVFSTTHMCNCWNKAKNSFAAVLLFEHLMFLQLVIASCPFLKQCVYLSPISGMSLSAGSSPLHSPKITPHTSPAPRRRSHTPNPANYMVPTTTSDPGTHIIQKETVGGTTYFYTDNTPAPMAGMVRWGNICRLNLETHFKT